MDFCHILHAIGIAVLVTERAGLENPRLRAETDLKAAEEAFAASGGKHWEARQDRNHRLGELASLQESLRSQLLNLAAGELPLALVPDLLRHVEVQDRAECEANSAAVIHQLLVERDGELLDLLRGAGRSARIVQLATDFLAADRAGREPKAATPRRLNLSDAARSLLHLRDDRLAAQRDEASRLLDQLARATQESEDLERAAAATPADADVGAVVERLKQTTQALALLDQKASQLDAAIAAEREKLDECQGKLGKIWQGRMEKEFARDDAGKMMELAGRTQETMQVFLQRVTERKIDRLSALITESFRFLLRKQALVARIIIDPATFAITVYDQEGQAIAKQRLSEGEKQIFAISVLWGLARASARPLPAVIDTPMARLDAAHRQHLVERYFPNASHQVVIFSTDTEVDRKYYADLQPHVARAYHLNYDERDRRTVGEEAYFWKD